MDLSHIETNTVETLFSKMVSAINRAIELKDLPAILEIFKVISRYKPPADKKPSIEMKVLSLLRSQGYITKLHTARTSLQRRTASSMYEMSGYIPSEKEKNDPRWKMALTVDIKPGTMQQNAKKFGWNIKRDGTPPLLRK